MDTDRLLRRLHRNLQHGILRDSESSFFLAVNSPAFIFSRVINYKKKVGEGKFLIPIVPHVLVVVFPTHKHPEFAAQHGTRRFVSEVIISFITFPLPNMYAFF